MAGGAKDTGKKAKRKRKLVAKVSDAHHAAAGPAASVAPAKKLKKRAAKPTTVSDAVRAFRDAVEHFRYPRASTRPWPLTNFTFFAGAGFSKAWDPDAPVGTALFEFDGALIDDVLDTEVLSRQFGVSREDIDLEAIRQIGYQIDMYERYPDIRSRYTDGHNLRIIRSALRAATIDRYAQLADLNYFDAETAKFRLPDLTPDRRAILALFAHLHRCADGSQGFAEGIRTNFVTTNYDFVIETILDNIIGFDDSMALYTYRGITPTRISGYSNPKPTHAHWLVSQLIKVNGGFEILRDGDGYALEYGQRSTAEVRRNPPVIMLPSREQDYGDPYFAAIFPKAVRLMRETRILVIVGYSLPEDDALMRFILRQFAEEPEDGRDKLVFYIDKFLTEPEMRAKLEAVFPTMSSYRAPTIVPFQGSFGEFAVQYASLIERSDRDL